MYTVLQYREGEVCMYGLAIGPIAKPIGKSQNFSFPLKYVVHYQSRHAQRVTSSKKLYEYLCLNDKIVNIFFRR